MAIPGRSVRAIAGRVAIVVALAAIASTVAAGPARAHAAYKTSSPPDGGTVSSPPSEVWAEYTELLSEGSYIRIYDPCGKRVDGGSVEISGYRMTVSVSASGSGTYTAEWFAVSAQDPHATDGKFTFTATEGASCAGGGGSGGGGEKAGGGGGSGSGGGGSGDPATATGSSGGGSGNGSGGSGTGRSESNGRAGNGGGKQRAGGGNPVDLEPIAAPRRRPDPPLVPRNIPLDGVLISVALAVVIGAAGGRVYAGIMGYRR